MIRACPIFQIFLCIQGEDLILDFQIFNSDQHDKENEITLLDKAKDKDLLLHPLMQIFLDLKFNTVWTKIMFDIFYQLLLVLVLTWMGVLYINFTTCRRTKGPEDDCQEMRMVRKKYT